MADDSLILITKICSGIFVALASGLAGYLYREKFDAPRLSIQYARIDVPKKSIALSDALFEALKIDGNIISFIQERVNWDVDVNLIVRKNEYSYDQIGEIRELLPQLLAKFKAEFDEEDRKHVLMEKILAKYNELSGNEIISEANNKGFVETLIQEFPDLSRHLAATRNYYQKVRQADIFEIFYSGPAKAIQWFISDLKGNLTQTKETIATISMAMPELDQKWEAGEPAAVPVTGDKVPEAKVTVVVSNTGRTDGLLQNTGSISISKLKAKLIGYDKKAGRRVGALEFYKIPAHGVMQMDLIVHKEETLPKTQKDMYEVMVSGEKSFKISLKDISGNAIEKKISN